MTATSATTTRYTIGILALLSVVSIWVSSSFLMNNIFENQKYNKPFFVTYINTASFSLYLIGPLLKNWLRKFRGEKTSSDLTNANHRRSIYGSFNQQEESLGDSTLEYGLEAVHQDDIPLSNREVAQLSFTFCILWFAANWATNASLAYTTVASSTIISSTSGFFTLAIGIFMKTETFNAVKLIAVCGSVLGVALVSESDRRNSDMEPTAPPASLFGDLLALLSALFYGCYTVLLKVKIQNENRVNMSLFFGSDYLWLLSMLMTSPLVVTLGLSLTIPLALLGDVVGYGRVLGLGYWLGAGLVLSGFFGVNGVAISELREAKEDEKQESSISQPKGLQMDVVSAFDERDPLLPRASSRSTI
ncbi:hypothetical protein BGZ76_011545 [Entomortierella beljakovae]|nr:hypothetical protein BGZ76_011545 [Entomortierella beljakovae]